MGIVRDYDQLRLYRKGDEVEVRQHTPPPLDFGHGIPFSTNEKILALISFSGRNDFEEFEGCFYELTSVKKSTSHSDIRGT